MSKKAPIILEPHHLVRLKSYVSKELEIAKNYHKAYLTNPESEGLRRMFSQSIGKSFAIKEILDILEIDINTLTQVRKED